MPRRKIPPDAFDFYHALGPSRSYRAVADHYGVSKRAVTGLAKRDDWQGRLAKIEAEARKRSHQRNVDLAEEARERRMTALRVVMRKGLEGLQNLAFDRPADAARAITLAVRELRVELGDPSERHAVSVEEVIKREYERWMRVPGQDDAADPADANDANSAGFPHEPEGAP